MYVRTYKQQLSTYYIQYVCTYVYVHTYVYVCTYASPYTLYMDVHIYVHTYMVICLSVLFIAKLTSICTFKALMSEDRRADGEETLR